MHALFISSLWMLYVDLIENAAATTTCSRLIRSDKYTGRCPMQCHRETSTETPHCRAKCIRCGVTGFGDLTPFWAIFWSKIGLLFTQTYPGHTQVSPMGPKPLETNLMTLTDFSIYLPTICYYSLVVFLMGKLNERNSGQNKIERLCYKIIS